MGSDFELRLPGMVLILLLCEYNIKFEINEAKTSALMILAGTVRCLSTD